jgi:hypothetical protein
VLYITLVAFTLALSALAIAGCGGGSKTTSTAASTATTTPTSSIASSGTTVTLAAGKPLSTAQWIAAGDAICAHANLKLSSVKIRTAQDFARLLPQAAAYDRAEISELRKLVPPTADRADWQQIIADLEKFTEYTDDVAQEMRFDNVPEARQALAAGSATRAALAAIAKRDGFIECAHV